MKKILYIVLGSLILWGVYCYKFNPGYHFTSCTCSYVFKFSRAQNESNCDRFCYEEDVTPITEKQEFINKICLKERVERLRSIQDLL